MWWWGPDKTSPVIIQCLPCASHLPVPFRAGPSEAALSPWWPWSEKAVSHSLVIVVVYNHFGCGLGGLFPHLNIAVVLLSYSCTILFSHICFRVPLRNWFLCWWMYLLELCFLFYFYFSVLLLNDWVLNWVHFPQWWSEVHCEWDTAGIPLTWALWETMRTDNITT